jgi:hypothetical protein
VHRSFTIKKLQDAYDCDLDLSDTVSSIYEGETDLTRRTIKVVPSFIHRDFSVPFTSNLRPANAQKRQRDNYEDPTSKRRRLEEQQHGLPKKDLLRDRPLPSTESEHSSDDGAGLIDTDLTQTTARLTRYKSGASVVITHNVHTGLDHFAPGVKEESPELGDPVAQPISDSEGEPSQTPEAIFKKPLLPASASKKAPRVRQLDRPRKESPQQTIPESPEQNGPTEVQDEDMQYGMEDEIMDDELSQHSRKTSRSPESSNDPTPEVSEPVRNGAAVPRKSIYEPPGSPDFIGSSAKRLRTYGRFPRTPRLVQKQAQAPNGSGTYSKSKGSGNGSSKSQSGINGKARVFQKPKLDEIESTPNEGPSSPIRSAGSPADDPFVSNNSAKAHDKSVDGHILAKSTLERPMEPPRSEASSKHKPGKVSGLKRPTRIAYTMPTAPTKNTIPPVQSSAVVLATPSITPICNPFRATTPLTKPPKKIVPVKAITVQDAASKPQNRELHSEASVSKSPKVGNASPSKAARASVISDTKSNLTRSSEKRNSPKVVIPKKMQFIPAGSHSSHSPLVQDSSSHPSASRSSVAEVASNLLNASRILAPEKEHPTSALKSPLHDRFKKPMVKASEPIWEPNSTKNDAVQHISESGDMRSTPVRTEIPLPDNVKHLASQRLSVSKSPRRSVTKSDVPLPDNVKHLNKPVKAGSVQPATPSNPKSVRQIAQPSSPPAMSSFGSTAEEPVEISSGESSSSDDSEEEEDVRVVVRDANIEHKEKEPVDEGDEETQDSPVMTRTVKETSPVQPELEEAELEEANAATSGDAESVPDADKLQTFSENEQASPEKDAAPDTADSSEPPRSPVEISSAVDYKANSSPHSILWNAGSWENGAVRQSAAATTSQKFDVEMADVSKSHSRSHSGSARTTKSESKSVAQSESISASGVDSTRSSPAVARQPARFLSHSPTPNNSSSEGESVAASPTPVETASSKLTIRRGEEIDSDSSSSDSDSSSDESGQAFDITDAEAEDSNVEMVDATVETKADAAPSFSPPSPQKSHRQVPPGSQPLPRKSEVPFPSTKSAIEVPSTAPPPRTKLSASQPNPQTPATGPRRPTYQKFPSIKEQLSAARSTPVIGQNNKGFDARTLKLSKLTKAKQQGKKGVMLNENSSSDESSSDESSSDESSSEDEGVGKGAGCSVA